MKPNPTRNDDPDQSRLLLFLLFLLFLRNFLTPSLLSVLPSPTPFPAILPRHASPPHSPLPPLPDRRRSTEAIFSHPRPGRTPPPVRRQARPNLRSLHPLHIHTHEKMAHRLRLRSLRARRSSHRRSQGRR